MPAMEALHIVPPIPDPGLEGLRQEVRDFIAQTLGDYPRTKRAESWNGSFSRDFALKLGARGWIGVTWPKQYGGHERTTAERYVVYEELLAVGAPIASCLALDRQTGPLLLEYGTEALKQDLLPRVARGELSFCVGLSEPDAGSDLASVRSSGRRTASGWELNGRKIWTSYAHEADYMIGLFRTSSHEKKHQGLSQFLLKMDTPGLTVRPIKNLMGSDHFNEVTFDQVMLPPEALIGKEGDGWAQVTRELSLERSGAERYMSSMQLLLEMVDAANPGDERAAVEIGKLVAEMTALREMSLGIAGMLARGESPALAAAVVKDRGTTFEQKIPEVAHDIFTIDLSRPDSNLNAVMAVLVQTVPQFSIRGGAREIMRGIIAKGLGLR
ncbi:MAG: putative Acyl-CoA dehydrogenase [Ramlibacter sp.]|nr:putative Acyl-CoA dehydrogenase [Ramlibacter sp.]